ncbi:MAG: Gfo/Idh/MocA family oxidoreductase [Armatimonadetes bacterium]|nr:Gfo/Idh/MocA family oxidoreductase [Armatimonadota bacterium]
MDDKRLSRREFMGRTGKAAAVTGFGLAAARGEAARTPGGRTAVDRRTIGANDKIRMALIGCGGMGRANMNNFMGHKDVEIIGLADVDANHLAQAAGDVKNKYGRDPLAVKDYRKLLEMKELDAVIIGTPDHWHALPMIHACEAGKDVYVEKPISHDVWEGLAMVNAAKKFGTVVQVGTWQRSTQHFVDAIDYVRSGKLGKVSVCRAWILGGAGVGNQKPQDPPAHLDWDFWLGPAPKVAYRPNRCHGSFRWFFDYAGGMAGDWGVHMIDIALLGMNTWHPQSVASYGGKILSGPQDDRDTPDTQIAIYKFNNPDFVLHWEVHVGAPGLDGGGDHGTEFIGSDAILRVDRGGWSVVGKDGQPREKTPSPNRVNDHWSNFLDCMRSRKTPRSDIETMHYTTAACHLANVAYRTGREIDWDGKTQRITNAPALMRDQSFYRAYRKPWSLPTHDMPAAPSLRRSRT